jgi:hypothetical protein
MSKIFLKLLLLLFVSSFAYADTQYSPINLDEFRASKIFRLTKWGFDIYDARFFRPHNFSEFNYHEHRFAIELTYLRQLKGSLIAEQSIQEMKPQPLFNTQKETVWLKKMQEIFPNINKGQKNTGINIPGEGAEFWLNENKIRKILEPEFSKYFFGIWLYRHTSAPELRQFLIQ